MAVRFDFKPGERINEVELARRLNVSRTPLREVLNQLMVEGFLTRAVNRGFIARLLDAKQIHSLYEYRAVLESGIVRAACERASDAELAELRAFVERSRDVPEDSEATRLLELDEAFHLMLARYSRNEEFVRALESVNARIHFVRWIDMQQGRRAHTQAEHMRIVQALERRDIEALPAMMGAHIGRRLDQITDVIRTGFPTSTCGTRPTPRRQRRPTPQQGTPMIHTLYRRALAMACAVAAIGGLGMAADAAAEERPLILVVPYPPGGSTDILARILQPRLSQELGGRAVVVENRPGAASQIATAFVARAEPDGNTLLVSFDNHGINPAVKPKLPYDTFKDFVAITQTVRFPLVLGANPSVPGDNLKDFLAAAARQPANRYNYASTGVGSLNHLAPEELKRLSKVELLHVPYGGGGPAIQAVVGGQANMTWLSFAALRGQIQAGKIKPLAVAGEKAGRPAQSTVAESGFPVVAYSWAACSRPRARRCHDQEADPRFQGRAGRPGRPQEIGRGGLRDRGLRGPALDAYVKAEYERWNAFIKTSNINLEN